MVVHAKKIVKRQQNLMSFMRRIIHCFATKSPWKACKRARDGNKLDKQSISQGTLLLFSFAFLLSLPNSLPRSTSDPPPFWLCSPSPPPETGLILCPKFCSISPIS